MRARVEKVTVLGWNKSVMGVANYYGNMWARRSHKLAPLAKINSCIAKFKCNRIEQD